VKPPSKLRLDSTTILSGPLRVSTWNTEPGEATRELKWYVPSVRYTCDPA
jgi:hypothetical protein